MARTAAVPAPTAPQAGSGAPARPRAADAPAAPEAAPRLAPGVELIGRFEDSGFREPPYIARRRDGQVVQLPELLFRLAEQVDGRADVATLAARFSERIRRQVQPADVAMLIDQQLRPLGVVALPGDTSLELEKVDPLLALKFRAAVVPDRAVRAATTLFQPLFLAPVVVLVVAGLLGVDAWLLLVHGISQSVRNVLYQPLLMLMLIAGVVLATAFHELGHASAVRFGGARPGVMGVGVYIVWPAFYTDITDAYRLDKRGRLRADLGGIYFNAIFALAIAGAYAATGWEPLLLLILLQNFAILQQLLPLLRLDGYYVLSDLTGVPDIFLRLRPVLASFLPGREPDPRVTELKPWVRAVVSAYVVGVVGFLATIVVLLVVNLPRMVSTGYDSVALHLDAVGPAFRSGSAATGVVDVLQMLFLILPAAGLGLTAARVGRRTAGGALRWSEGQPGRRVLLAAGTAAAVALAAFSWWPNGEYRPIQPGERGTLLGAVGQLAAIPSGRPSLTAARAAALGGAPTERQRRSARSTAGGPAVGRSTGSGGIPAGTSGRPAGGGAREVSGAGTGATGASGPLSSSDGGSGTAGPASATATPGGAGTTGALSSQTTTTSTPTTSAPASTSPTSGTSTSGTSTSGTTTTGTTSTTQSTPPPAGSTTTTTTP